MFELMIFEINSGHSPMRVRADGDELPPARTPANPNDDPVATSPAGAREDEEPAVVPPRAPPVRSSGTKPRSWCLPELEVAADPNRPPSMPITAPFLMALIF